MVRDRKSNTPGTGIRDAIAEDLSDVVRVHQTAFRGFFLDRMGPRFLRAYYSAVLGYPGAIFLVNVDKTGDIDGFAAGFRDPGGFYDHFRSLRPRLAPIIALALLRRPSLLAEIVRNTRRVATPGTRASETVELSSIGTSRIGTGVGAALLEAFCARSVQLSAKEITLSTDRDNNGAVLNFYLKHGFEKRGTEHRGTRVLQIMSRHVSGET